MDGRKTLTKAQREVLTGAVIEQATEACAGGGPHHDGLAQAVVNYLIGHGDEELAEYIAESTGLELAGRSALTGSGEA